ncbi:MAG TPA: porin family protein [Candidatus Acidoferrales bacterium]|nr:porin family protein [Candidatus Acidoferrales bacterium]
MHWGKLLLCLMLFGILGVSSAQAQHAIEVTPFGGVRFGGVIDINTADVDYLPIHSSSNFGATIDYTVWPGFQAELLWSEQPTFLSIHSISSGETIHLSSANLNTYNVGFLYQFRPAEAKLHPYIAAGIGVTHFSAGQLTGKNFLNFSNRLSYNFGLGAKYYFNDHFGIRVESRWLPSRTTAGTGQYCDPFSGFCSPVRTNNHAEQGSADIGLIIRFH